MNQNVLFGGDCGIPTNVALCPECGSALHVDVYEWDSATGAPTIGGFNVDCADEDNRNHRYYQSDWQPIIDRVAEYIEATEA